MFSVISDFLPTRRLFSDFYDQVSKVLDFREVLTLPKEMAQAAFDKDFWSAHYKITIEELMDAVMREPISEKIVTQLQNQLIECQSLVGRYTLAPQCYEDGIIDLLEVLKKRNKNDESLIAATLEDIYCSFRQALKEQRAFSKECFVGEINHLLAHYKKNKITQKQIRKKITYYSDVMEPWDYYDGLKRLAEHLENNSSFSLLARIVKSILSNLNLLTIEQSRQELIQLELKEQASRNFSNLVQDTRNTEISESKINASTFLTRSWAGISKLSKFIIKNPLQAITAGLAVQSSAVMAFRILPTAMPSVSPGAVVINTQLDGRLIPRLTNAREFFEHGHLDLSLNKLSMSRVKSLEKKAIADSKAVKLLKQSTTEFQINTFTNNEQFYPSVTTLANGGFLVTWDSYGQDGSNDGVYAQRYEAVGTQVGNEFRVNTYTNAGQYNPSATTLSNGDLVVIWQSYGQDGSSDGVYGQRYNAAGISIGNEFRINTYTNGDQSHPSVATLEDEGFVVAWHSDIQDGSGYGIYAQRYDLAGAPVGHEFQVNVRTNNDQTNPSIAGLINGGFVVTWMSNGQEDGGDYSVLARQYDVEGVPGNEFLVNGYSAGAQAFPSITALANGGFVVIWQSYLEDGSSWGTYGRCYQSSGAYGNEFQINIRTNSDQSTPSVAALEDGGFVVTWHSESQDGNGYGIYGRHYDGMATPGNEFQVNIYTSGDQMYPSIAALRYGSFVVTWMSNGQDGSGYGIYGRLYTPPVLQNSRLNINQGQAVVLTSAMLSASDLDDNVSALTFVVSDVQNGYFTFLDNPEITITDFTQQQIMNQRVQFVHNGSQNPPSYRISVSDGMLSTTPTLVTISFGLATPSATPGAATTRTSESGLATPSATPGIATTHTSESVNAEQPRSNDGQCTTIACQIGIGIAGAVASGAIIGAFKMACKKVHGSKVLPVSTSKPSMAQ